MIRPQALIVRGGWDGHDPVTATERFIPFLAANGYEIRVEESTAVYADPATMAATDLVIQCVTMSEITYDEVMGLRAAVQAGTGLTGWHGGIADSFRASSDYLQLIGAQFATHPARQPVAMSHDVADINFRTYTIDFTPLGRSHWITEGLEDFELTTEQYWVLHDDLNDVLATTTHPAPEWQPWHRPIGSPAIWTRSWGKGRVVVTTPGHSVEILDDKNITTVIERGILWATRTA